jgi:DEAD/DEAH box helicase/Helicase conserved C-terminal domain
MGTIRNESEFLANDRDSNNNSNNRNKIFLANNSNENDDENNNFGWTATSKPFDPIVCPIEARRGLRNARFKDCFERHVAEKIAPYVQRSANAVKAGSKNALNQLCIGDTLAPQQLVVYEIAKLMAVYPPNQLGGHRGLLCWHNTGSGKTISALSVIMAFWPIKNLNIVVVTSRSNLQKVLTEYIQHAPKFFPKQVEEILRTSKNQSFEEAFKKRVESWSFIKARNRLAQRPNEFITVKTRDVTFGAGTVLIIDEIQGLLQQGHFDFKRDAIALGCKLRTLTPQQMEKVKVFGLSATPAATIKEWLKVLSIVRRCDQPVAFTDDNDSRGVLYCKANSTRDMVPKVEKWLEQAVSTKIIPDELWRWVNTEVAGLVSFVDTRYDISRHACVKNVLREVPMDRIYYLLLMKLNVAERRKANDTTKSAAQFEYNPRSPMLFYRKMRVFSNSLPKSVWETLPTELVQKIRERKRIVHDPDFPGGRFVSRKVTFIAQFLHKNQNCKHYVYTTAGNGGIVENPNVIAAALRQWYGYVDVSHLAENASSLEEYSANGRRGHFIVLGDSTTKLQRKRLVNVFNSLENKNGKYISVLIATGQLYEGIDLLGLRFVHIMDPLPNALYLEQALGRGVRLCGHKGLELSERNVTLIRWVSSIPRHQGWEHLASLLKDMYPRLRPVDEGAIKREYFRNQQKSYDQLVYARLFQDKEYVRLQNFERIIKSTSIDCAVLSPFYKGGGQGCSSKPIMKTKVALHTGRPCS